MTALAPQFKVGDIVKLSRARTLPGFEPHLYDRVGVVIKVEPDKYNGAEWRFTVAWACIKATVKNAGPWHPGNLTRIDEDVMMEL